MNSNPIASRWIRHCLNKHPDWGCGLIYQEGIMKHGDSIGLTWEEFASLYSDIRYLE